MSDDRHDAPAALWLEFPPITSNATPSRLLVFFHAPGMDAASFAPVALHWHLKFPSAIVTIMESAPNTQTALPSWIASTQLNEESPLEASCVELVRRVRSAQLAFTLGPEKTMVIAQGTSASILLESLRRHHDLAHLAVSYGGRFASALRSDEQFATTIHLVHGELDSQVPLLYAQRAIQSLTALKANASLDVIEGGTHQIDQDMVNIGTMRAMQTVFRGRQPKIQLPAPGSLAGKPFLH
jgi:phospholipase/carboxylesterase